MSQLMSRISAATLDPDEPWLQAPEESDEQYRWFVAFLELGDQRSIELLSHKLSLMGATYRPLLHNVKHRFLWDDRAYAYDQIRAKYQQLQSQQRALTSHETRVALLGKFVEKMGHLIERMDDLLVEGATLTEVADALKIVVTLLQSEYQGPPVPKTAIQNNQTLQIMPVLGEKRKAPQEDLLSETDIMDRLRVLQEVMGTSGPQQDTQ